MFELERAGAAHLGDVMRVLAEARAGQRAAGFRQWDDGYPSEVRVLADMAEGAAFVLLSGGERRVAGYVALTGGDAEYDRLGAQGGLWSGDGAYGVAHRFALGDGFRGCGLGSLFIGLVEAEMRSRGAEWMRVDTGTANMPMQRLLERSGYRCCGCCDFAWGPRLAYDKRL